MNLLPTFIIIPSTPFLIGSRVAELSDLARAYGGTRESYREESPQHELTLPAFAIAQTPTTNALYAAYVAATGTTAPLHWRGMQPPAELLDHPVVDVSWEDAQAFCVWLGEEQKAQSAETGGQGDREAENREPRTENQELPRGHPNREPRTENQELGYSRDAHASVHTQNTDPTLASQPIATQASMLQCFNASMLQHSHAHMLTCSHDPLPRFRLPTEAEWEHVARGVDGRRFPWGEEWDATCANTREAQLGGTQPVGSYPAGVSPYGCLDMAGTIWEWTSSLDRAYPYDPHDGREDSQAPGRRILRGGCYANPHGYARCACRFRMPPAMRNEFLGFRLAFSLPVG